MSYFPEEDFTVINGIWAIEEERFLEITVNGRDDKHGNRTRKPRIIF